MASRKSYLVDFIRISLQADAYPNLFYLDDSMSRFVFLHHRNRYSPDDGEDYMQIFQMWNQLLKNKRLSTKIPKDEAAPLIFVLKRSAFFTLISMDRDKYVFKFNSIEGYQQQKKKTQKKKTQANQSTVKKGEELNEPFKSRDGDEIADTKPCLNQQQNHPNETTTKENESNELLRPKLRAKTAAKKLLLKRGKNQMKQSTKENEPNKPLKSGCNANIARRKQQTNVIKRTTTTKASNEHLKSTGETKIGRNPLLKQQNDQMRQLIVTTDGAIRNVTYPNFVHQQSQMRQPITVANEVVTNMSYPFLKKKKNQKRLSSTTKEGVINMTDPLMTKAQNEMWKPVTTRGTVINMPFHFLKLQPSQTKQSTTAAKEAVVNTLYQCRKRGTNETPMSATAAMEGGANMSYPFLKRKKNQKRISSTTKEGTINMTYPLMTQPQTQMRQPVTRTRKTIINMPSQFLKLQQSQTKQSITAAKDEVVNTSYQFRKREKNQTPENVTNMPYSFPKKKKNQKRFSSTATKNGAMHHEPHSLLAQLENQMRRPITTTMRTVINMPSEFLTQQNQTKQSKAVVKEGVMNMPYPMTETYANGITPCLYFPPLASSLVLLPSGK